MTVTLAGNVGPGVYYLNVSSALKYSADIYGQCSKVWFNGSAIENYINVSAQMPGTIYCNELTTLDSEHGSLIITPTGYCRVAIMDWVPVGISSYVRL